MSEYQYYEFAMADRPMTDDEMDMMESLSSRAEVTPYRASYVYNYGDFRGEPRELLEEHFDAMFHIANWGTVWLMFKLPLSAVDLERMREYVVEHEVDVYASGESVIVSVLADEMDLGWVEGEGYLDMLLPLREALLNGDLRMLYVAWLGCQGVWEEEGELDDPVEVPVPPGLQEHDSALETVAQLFEVEKFLVQAAAEESPPMPSSSPESLAHRVRQMPEEERVDFLVRIASGEARVGSVLRRRLELLATADEDDRWAPARPGRTVRQLTERAEALARLDAHRRRKEKEAQLQARLRQITTRWEYHWNWVEEILKTTSGSAYDRASKLVVELHQAARQENMEEQLNSRMRAFFRNHGHRPKLVERLRHANIVPLNSGAMLWDEPKMRRPGPSTPVR